MFIEQGLAQNGKRYEWEVGKESGNPLSALFQDFDWADEVLHARVGRDWYVSTFEDPKNHTLWRRMLEPSLNGLEQVGFRQNRAPKLVARMLSGGLCSEDLLRPQGDCFQNFLRSGRADLKNLSASA